MPMSTTTTETLKIMNSGFVNCCLSTRSQSLQSRNINGRNYLLIYLPDYKLWPFETNQKICCLHFWYDYVRLPRRHASSFSERMERGWTTCCCKRTDANSLRKQGVLRVTSVNNSSSAKCAFSICLGVKSWGEHIRACHCLLVDCA